MSMENLYKYPCEIVPLAEEDGGGYLARFPDLPGVASDGETPEEALANGLDALKGALEAMAEWNKPIPEPGHASGRMALRLPKSLHAKLKLRAAADEVSENMTAVALIAEGLGLREGTSGQEIIKKSTGKWSGPLSRNKAGRFVAAEKKPVQRRKRKTG